MRITEGQLRRIIRQELNEMGGMSKYGSGPFDPEEGYVDDPASPMHGRARMPAEPVRKGVTLRPGPGGKWIESEMSDFPGEGAEMARAVGGARAGASSAPAHVKQDIYEKLSKHGGMTKKGILMSLSAKYRPAQIEDAISDMVRRGDIDQDDRGVYHIAGYEEYADPGEEY